jgi:hypothetical protein
VEPGEAVGRQCGSKLNSHAWWYWSGTRQAGPYRRHSLVRNHVLLRKAGEEETGHELEEAVVHVQRVGGEAGVGSGSGREETGGVLVARHVADAAADVLQQGQ